MKITKKLTFMCVICTLFGNIHSKESKVNIPASKQEKTNPIQLNHLRDSLSNAWIKARNSESHQFKQTNITPSSSSQTKVIDLKNTANNSTIPSSSSSYSSTNSEVVIMAQMPNNAKDSIPISDTLLLESMNVRDVDIRDLFQGLAMQFTLNIVLSPEVQGKVSVNFNKIPVRQAVQMLLRDNGYSWESVGQAIRIYRAKPVEFIPEIRNEITWIQNKLSFDLKGIDCQEVIRKLIQITGKNIILDKSVQGKWTALVKELEWDRALKILAQTNDLQLREIEGVPTFYKQSWAGENTSNTAGMAMNRGMWIQVKDSNVSIELQNAPISQVISTMITQSGLNAVIYGNLNGSVTAKLKDVKVFDALKYIFRESQFTFWSVGNVLFVGPLTMGGGNNSKLIKMKFAKADEVMESLPSQLTKNCTIKMIKGLNALMVLGSYEDIDAIQRYVEQMDQPVPMILIEALVVDVDLDKVRDYGLKLFIGKTPDPGTREGLYPSISQVFNKDQANTALEAIGLKDIISLPKNFTGQVNALEQEKALKIRSRPLIATLNGKTATITVGQTQYYLLKTQTDLQQSGSVTNRVTENFTKIDANVTLTVTPFVTGEGEVTCEIEPDFSEPEGSFDAKTPPTINRRTLKSNVKLRDGETIVLGGLVKESKEHVTDQVPFFGSIPILGWLFKNARIVTSRSQLMIFVTPRVFYDSEARVNIENELEKYSK